MKKTQLKKSINFEKCDIYLVDDDQAMVNATSQWLTLSGLKLRTFSEPLALLRSIKTVPKKPIVVISDIRMPDMNGLELLNNIKAKNNDIPVILITGHGDVELAVEAMKAGAYEFLTKPFSPERLLESVESAIEILIKQASKEKEKETLAAKTFTEKMEQERARLENEKTEEDSSQHEDLNERIAQFEQTIIRNALLKNNGNIAAVLNELKIPRRTLNQKMNKYNLVSKDFKPG